MDIIKNNHNYKIQIIHFLLEDVEIIPSVRFIVYTFFKL